MKRFYISTQKVISIIKKESQGDPHLVFRDLKERRFSEFLLATGAKLFYHPAVGWCIFGYAADGRDVTPYERR